MSKTLKWILGIAAVLVLVAALFAVGYMRQTRMAYGWNETPAFDLARQHPMMRDNWDGPRQRGDWNHPMTNTRRFSPFGGFFFFGGLVKFALFAGLLYGAYWLGRRNARVVMDPKPTARVDASAPPSGSDQ